MVVGNRTIVVNDIVATPDAGGVFSILEDFYDHISKIDDDTQWILLLSGKYFDETNNIKIVQFPEIKKNWLKRLWFEFHSGRKLINSFHPDVYFSLQNTMTIGVKANKKIAYVHQPLSFQTDIKFSLFKKNERNLAIHQKMIGRFINYTLKKEQPEIIVQTQWMKSAILERNITTEDNVKIIRPAQNLEGVKPVGDIEKIFFYPSIVRTYKNHELIFSAIEILNNIGNFDYKVVLTGHKEEFSDHQSFDDKIDFVGTIPRREVYDEYRESVLVFPSLMETFGLPLAEAEKVGTIIFAADVEYAHDVLGNYRNAYFFNPKSAEDLARLMLQFIEGKIPLYPSKGADSLNIIEKPSRNLIEEVLYDGGA